MTEKQKEIIKDMEAAIEATNEQLVAGDTFTVDALFFKDMVFNLRQRGAALDRIKEQIDGVN